MTLRVSVKYNFEIKKCKICSKAYQIVLGFETCHLISI